MSLTLDEVAAISRGVALEHGRALQIAGVTLTGGSSDRVEVLVTVTGCHQDPCRILINISRADGAELASQLRTKLQQAMRQHVSTGGAPAS